MGRSREVITQHLAERLCWQAAQRDEARVARRLYRTEVVDGVYHLDEGALLDAFFHFLQELGVLEWMAGVQGTALQREMVPVVQYLLRYGLKTLCGMERMKARPALLCSDEALLPWVGFNAQQVRHGVCQRGAAKRQCPRTVGPICPEPLANNLGQLNLRDLEVWCNGTIRALAKAGLFGAKVTGISDATDLETTARDAGCGPVTRKRQVIDQRGTRHEIEVTVDGWQPMVLSDAATKIPLAVKVVPIQAHAVLSRRALVTQARTNLTGHTRLHKVVVDRGCLDGVDRWWLDQHGMTCVVPAQGNMAVTADARAQAAAGEEITVGRRVPTVRHGQGREAWTERLETEVVGSTGLTTDDQDGTVAHRREANRRDFQAHPIKAVVVRQGQGKDYGPGGNTVFLTNASVDKPLQPFDDDDERRLIEHCGIKEAKQPWNWGHPPQKTGRAVRVHVLFTFLMFALATVYRLRCERAAVGAEPGQGHRLCSGVVWPLSPRGVRSAGGGQAQRRTARHWDTPRRAGHIQAHRSRLILILEPQYSLPFSLDRILPPVLVSQNSHSCPVGLPERGTTSILAVPSRGSVFGSR